MHAPAALLPSLVLLLSAPICAQSAPLGQLLEKAVKGAEARVHADLLAGVDLAAGRPEPGQPWQIRLDRVEVRMAGRRHEVASLAQGIDNILGGLEELFPPEQPLAGPIPLIVAADVGTYQQIGTSVSDGRSSNYGGFYDPNHPEGAAVAVDLGGQQSSFLKVHGTFATVLAWLDRSFPARATQGVPWLDAAIASYAAHLWFQEWAVDNFNQMVSDGGFIPFAQLLNTPFLNYGAQVDAFLFELNALFHYLLNVRTETRLRREGDQVVAPFRDLIRKFLAGSVDNEDPVLELFTRERTRLEADLRGARLRR